MLQSTLPFHKVNHFRQLPPILNSMHWKVKMSSLSLHRHSKKILILNFEYVCHNLAQFSWEWPITSPGGNGLINFNKSILFIYFLFPLSNFQFIPAVLERFKVKLVFETLTYVPHWVSCVILEMLQSTLPFHKVNHFRQLPPILNSMHWKVKMSSLSLHRHSKKILILNFEYVCHNLAQFSWEWPINF